MPSINAAAWVQSATVPAATNSRTVIPWASTAKWILVGCPLVCRAADFAGAAGQQGRQGFPGAVGDVVSVIGGSGSGHMGRLPVRALLRRDARGPFAGKGGNLGQPGKRRQPPAVMPPGFRQSGHYSRIARGGVIVPIVGNISLARARRGDFQHKVRGLPCSAL